MRRVRQHDDKTCAVLCCVRMQPGHFEHLSWTHAQIQFVSEETRYNSETRSNRAHVYTNLFYCFRVRNLPPKRSDQPKCSYIYCIYYERHCLLFDTKHSGVMTLLRNNIVFTCYVNVTTRCEIRDICEWIFYTFYLQNFYKYTITIPHKYIIDLLNLTDVVRRSYILNTNWLKRPHACMYIDDSVS